MLIPVVNMSVIFRKRKYKYCVVCVLRIEKEKF